MLSQHLSHPALVNQDLANTRRTARNAPIVLARNPYVSLVIIVALLVVTTWGLLVIQDATHAPRPYTIFYLIPVAIGAALLGLRAGYVTVVLSIVLAYVFLFRHNGANTSIQLLHDSIEILAMAIGTLTIATVVGRLRNALVDLSRLNEDLTGERRAQSFCSIVRCCLQ